MYRLLPSLLSATPSALPEQIRSLERAGADALHIDMMDGAYVPRTAFAVEEVEAIRDMTEMVLDIHVMTLEPQRVAKAVAQLGAVVVSVHWEACTDIVGTLRAILEMGAKAGVVLRPETPVAVLGEEVFAVADAVQLMSVQPGMVGQSFLSQTIPRIREAKARMRASESHAVLQVDGDINLTNLSAVLQAGADSVVVGSALFAGELEQTVRCFRQVMREVQQEETVWHT